MFKDLRIPRDRFSQLVTDELTIQLMPERDIVWKMMTTSGRLEKVAASLTTSREKRLSLPVENNVAGKLGPGK